MPQLIEEKPKEHENESNMFAGAYNGTSERVFRATSDRVKGMFLRRVSSR